MKTEWLEPPAFKRALERSQGIAFSVWPAARIAGIVTLVMFAALAWHRKPLAGGSWPLTFLVCFLPGLCVFVLPLIEWAASNKIVLSKNGLTRSVMNGGGIQMTQWTWEQIHGARMTNVVFDSETFPAIVLDTSNGPVPVGLAEKTNRSLVRDLFETHDKPFADELDT